LGRVPVPRGRSGLFLLAVLLFCCGPTAWSDEPLQSWNDGPARQAIVDFVARATEEGGKDFVFDRIRALAPKHPE
jgi:hypothetical protein